MYYNLHNDVVLPSSNPEIKGLLWKYKEKIPYKAEASTYNYNDPHIVFNFSATGSTDYWHGEGERNTISIEFIKHKIQIAFYSFQTFDFECNKHSHAKSWDFYGTTIDGEEILLDDVDDNDICGNLSILTHPVYSNSFFKSFKFKMTATNHDGNWKFTIFKVDFYGKIQDFKIHDCCTKSSLEISISHIYFVIFCII